MAKASRSYRVIGSNPISGTIVLYTEIYRWVRKWSKQAGCNPVRKAFVGSNPTPPTQDAIRDMR